MLRALRVRDFRLLWGAGLISSVGSWLLVLAVPAHVFLLTRSVTASGLTMAAEYLPWLALGPLAGVLADRWDRRRLMIAADVFRAGAVAFMLLGATASGCWLLYVALAAESGGTVVFAPALQARTPEVVGTGKLLSSANALNAVSDGVVRLIGGPLGGMLLAVCGFRVLICADVLSYLVSAAALAMTSRRPGQRAARSAPVREAGRDFASGWSALCGQPVARALAGVTVVFLAANAALSAVVVPFGVARLGGVRQTGYLFSALGVGFLLGAPAVRLLLDRVQPRYLLTGTLTATAAAYCLLFHSSSLAAALPAAVAVGMFGSMSLVVPQTTLQRVVPNSVLGRVTSVFLAGEAAVTLAGSVAGPALARLAQTSGVAVASSAVTLTAAVLAYLLVPVMKDYPRTVARGPAASGVPHEAAAKGSPATAAEP